uniref:DUF5645 domain-containing protein n=1 Tax=Anopheles epiroticus TaxID=199890 RepID=A0A182PWF7_9DIPT
MDPLRPASVEELKTLIQLYKQRLPESIQFVSLLQNILRTNTTLSESDKQRISHRLRKTVYVPNKEDCNQFATFIAVSCEEVKIIYKHKITLRISCVMTIAYFQDPFILPNTLEDPPTELTIALQQTTYINWNLKPVFTIGPNSDIRARLTEIIAEHKLPLESRSDCINFWMPKEEAAKLNPVVPNDVELKPLRFQHGKLINEWWPYRYPSSQRYFESAIEHYGGFGLFDKTSQELVACVFQNDHDAVGSKLNNFFTATYTQFLIEPTGVMEVHLLKLCLNILRTNTIKMSILSSQMIMHVQ